MTRAKPTDAEATPTKAERTRERIREAAFSLFAEVGYEATTMRAIAARAECALGLIYRYFPRREDLVLELYRTSEVATLERWVKLRPGTLAERVERALAIRVELVWPHRETFRAVAGAVLNPDSGVGLFSAETQSIREQTRAALREVVVGASDAPNENEVAVVVDALFVGQLAVLLAATQDPRADGRATKALVKSVGEMLGTMRPLLPLALPMLAKMAAHLAAFER